MLTFSLESLLLSPKSVYVHDGSLQQFANSDYYEEELKHRMEVFSLEESQERFVEIYENVKAGTHVMLEYEINVDFIYHLVLPQRFKKCGIFNEFLRSSPPLIGTIGAWKWKNDFKYADEFNDMALRLAAAGIIDFYTFSDQRYQTGHV